MLEEQSFLVLEEYYFGVMEEHSFSVLLQCAGGTHLVVLRLSSILD